jgi:Ca2+-binding EF-hand superfamily protein
MILKISFISQLDTDNSGDLDQLELTTGLEKMGVRLSRFEMGLVFELFDEDGDGTIE